MRRSASQLREQCASVHRGSRIEQVLSNFEFSNRNLFKPTILEQRAACQVMLLSRTAKRPDRTRAHCHACATHATHPATTAAQPPSARRGRSEQCDAIACVRQLHGGADSLLDAAVVLRELLAVGADERDQPPIHVDSHLHHLPWRQLQAHKCTNALSVLRRTETQKRVLRCCAPAVQCVQMLPCGCTVAGSSEGISTGFTRQQHQSTRQAKCASEEAMPTVYVVVDCKHMNSA